jgi:hypothetical protein
MFLSINGKIHSVTKRIVKGKTIKYLSVTPAVEEIAGKIQMFRDDGFLLSEDNADDYARKTYVGTLLTISNDPEPAPVTPQPTVEQRVTALENAIKEGLSL